MTCTQRSQWAAVHVRPRCRPPLQTPSLAVHKWCLPTLSITLKGLTFNHLPMHKLAAQPTPLLACGLCRWLDKSATGFELLECVSMLGLVASSSSTPCARI